MQPLKKHNKKKVAILESEGIEKTSLIRFSSTNNNLRTNERDADQEMLLNQILIEEDALEKD